MFWLCTGRGQCCINAAPCNRILFSSPLTLSCRLTMWPISFSPPLCFSTHKRPPKQLNFCSDLFHPKILSDEKSSVACGPQGWPGCQSVLGHKRLCSQHCPFSACHMSTVTLSLCVRRIDLHLRMLPQGLCGSLRRSSGSLVSCLSDPWATRAPHVSFSVPFSTSSFRGTF